MKTLRLYYTLRRTDRKVQIKLYKTTATLQRAHPKLLGALAVCSEVWFVDGRHGILISLSEENYTFGLIAHECDHAASKLMSFRHRDWCQRRGCEEGHARIVQDLTTAIIEHFGSPTQ